MADSWLTLGTLDTDTTGRAWSGVLAYEGDTLPARIELDGDSAALLYLGNTAERAHLARRTASTGVDYLTARVVIAGDTVQLTAWPNRAGGLTLKYVASTTPTRQPDAPPTTLYDQPDAAAAALSKLRSRRNAQFDPF